MNIWKHYGKTIKRYHYLPLLDDANINDQGIDAAGLSTTMKVTITISHPDKTSTGNGWVDDYVCGEGADAGSALTAAQVNAQPWFEKMGYWDTNYTTSKAAAEADGYVFTENAAVPESGNLYGSSKDVGTIVAKLPALSETGGRVNRVGFKRIELEGSIEKFGFFDEYTKESVDFDTDAQLDMHVNREMIMGANEMTEDALQVDLLNSAGVVKYGGTATSKSTITGEGTVSTISYEDLMRLNIDLDDNRCPKNTTIITGSRMIDTRTVNAARYLYIGSELIPSVKKMVDTFGNKAFISVEQYANAGTLARGEIGTVDQFRIIVVPEMQHWAGAGAAVTANEGYRTSMVGGTEHYNVYPMLVVGSGSFTTIGFQTDGKTTKFKIKHSKPESTESYGYHDPYGEIGFMSIKWYYGMMVLRPERIAICYSVAEW